MLNNADTLPTLRCTRANAALGVACWGKLAKAAQPRGDLRGGPERSRLLLRVETACSGKRLSSRTTVRRAHTQSFHSLPEVCQPLRLVGGLILALRRTGPTNAVNKQNIATKMVVKTATLHRCFCCGVATHLGKVTGLRARRNALCGVAA